MSNRTDDKVKDRTDLDAAQERQTRSAKRADEALTNLAANTQDITDHRIADDKRRAFDDGRRAADDDRRGADDDRRAADDVRRMTTPDATVGISDST